MHCNANTPWAASSPLFLLLLPCSHPMRQTYLFHLLQHVGVDGPRTAPGHLVLGGLVDHFVHRHAVCRVGVHHAGAVLGGHVRIS